MTKITQKNVIEELLKRIPEIKKSTDWKYVENEQELPTIIFDHFGTFLLDIITESNDPLNDDIIKRSFDLINEMQLSDDPEVQNLSQVGVFEVLAGSNKGIEIASILLNKRGNELFNEIKKNFYPN